LSFVACGTGKLASLLAPKCSKVIGIDLSIKNINVAKARQIQNTEFIHGDATKLKENIADELDIAVISLALHEMPPNVRSSVIDQMKQAAEELIFADYVVPMPTDLTGKGVHLVEFFAGKHHFAGYRHFQKNGGLDSLLNESKLHIVEKYYSHNNTIVIYKTRKNNG
jgi:SAM-dependent methyltransferase